MKNKIEVYHYFLLAAFIILAYWPLSFFRHTLTWDTAQCYFPYRYFLSDCLRNGQLPLWNPYQECGYPFYADPQSGVFYPLAVIFGSVAPYSLYTLAIEYITIIIIGSTGIYQLIKSFQLSRHTSLFAALIYSCCGFFISNAEHQAWLTSAAWLPWVFWAYHKMVQTYKYGYALICALFLYMLMSGGYPAFITVAIYLIIIFFLVLFFKKDSEKKQLLKLHCTMGVVFALIAGAALWAWAGAAPYTNRGAGLTLAKANVHPFAPHSMLSFLLPFASLKNDAFYQADISMRNGYFGLFGLLFFIWGSIKIKRGKPAFLLLIVLFCLATAFGPYLPLRGWLYHYVPLMNMFRFPSLFRIFFIIGALVISAIGFQSFHNDAANGKKMLKRLLPLMILILAGLYIYSVIKHGGRFLWTFGFHTFREHLKVSTHAENVQLQCILQVLLLSVLLFTVYFKGGKWLTGRLVLGLCCVDMFIATQMNMFGTIVGDATVKDLTASIKDGPRSFPLPDNTIAVAANNDSHMAGKGDLNANSNIYFKQIGVDGLNPFVLVSYNYLLDSPYHDRVWKNHYLYTSSLIGQKIDTSVTKDSSFLLLRAPDYKFLSTKHFNTDKTDSIKMKRFVPNNVDAEIWAQDSLLLTLQQAYYKGWTIKVDNNPQQIFVSNFAYMTCIIPPGKHIVAWRFDPPFVKALGLVSLSALLLTVGSLFGFRKKLFDIEQ